MSSFQSVATPAILLRVAPQGETGLRLTVFSETHGKMTGFTRFSRKKDAATFQVGNILQVERFRRIETQLGTFSVELLAAPASKCLDDFPRLCVLRYLSDVLCAGLHDEEPHPVLFAASRSFLEKLTAENLWERLAFYELTLLTELGYALSLSYETGALPDSYGTEAPLVYVSPKSGRAVTEAMGAAYKEKLFRLPVLFGGVPTEGGALGDDLHAAFRLTGYFLEKALHGNIPASRGEVLALEAEMWFNS